MLSRSVLNSLLPSGAFWEPSAESDYDNLLEGIASNSEIVYQHLKQLSYLRDPDRTPILSDLEKEYGVIPIPLSTESERRARLKALMYNRTSTGAWDFLQQKLRDAGFTDVYVHPNDPAVDPNIFLAQAFNMMCGELLPGGNFAQCGEVEAQCAQVGGELIVNGDLFINTPNYVNLCGESAVQCDDSVFCGDFDGYKSTSVDIAYVIPADSGYWPLIFFVGGAATRDPVTGELTEIEFYTLPIQRRLEFRRLILKFKPLHSWGGLIVVYS